MRIDKRDVEIYFGMLKCLKSNYKTPDNFGRSHIFAKTFAIKRLISLHV